MSIRKSERLMNLLICLLVARTYVPKERIRQIVEAYRDQSDEAFEKMFERDKDELRDLGVPIELGYVEKGFEDEPGYRIRRDAFHLPEIRFDADEAAVVGLAARVWHTSALAEATSGALVKLRAGGVEVDTDALAVLEPRLGGQEPAFDPLWRAVVTRTAVTFPYQRPEGQPSTRHLEPWGILSWHGHWYVLGHDRDRDGVRMFRLSRVTGPVRTIGRPGAFEVPDDTDLRELAASLEPAAPTATARVRVREGRGLSLRRQATSVEPAGDGWDVLEVSFADSASLADQVLAHGADAVVEQPESVRDLVVAGLRRMAGEG